MKICRFVRNGFTFVGIVEGERVWVCKSGIGAQVPLPQDVLPLRELTLLAPVVPGKIIGIGRNYAEHARELGNVPPESEPLIFLKPTTAVTAPGDAIAIPLASQRVDYEGELGVVIGKQARNLPEEGDALEYVLGYTCVNDVTARDLQKKDVQFTRAKGFDTFCPLGPWIETALDPGALNVTTRVNGQVRQQGNTRDLIFPVPRLIRFLSGIMTLLPGDVIATGTPAGVGPLAHGDVVEVEVEGVGILRNPVVRAVTNNE